MTSPCHHLNAVKVENLLVPDAPPWAWLCPDCDEQLPAGFRPGKVRPRPAAASRPLAPRAPAYRPPRRRIAPVLCPLLAAGFVAGGLMAVALKPHGPEPYSAADATACQAWFARGARVPEGSGVTYIGAWEDPGHKKLAAAEDALNAGLGGVNQALSGAIQEWEADAESSYVLTPGDYGAALSMRHDRAAITSWCKGNKYT